MPGGKGLDAVLAQPRAAVPGAQRLTDGSAELRGYSDSHRDARMSSLEQKVASLEAAIDVVPMAMMVLDARQRVVRTNAAAEAMLSSGNALCLVGGMLSSRHDPQVLQQLLHGALMGVDRDGALRRLAGKAVLEDEAGRRTLVVDVHPLHTSESGTATAVLFLHPAGAKGNHLPTVLRRLFHLTASEAGLACALLQHGDLAAAALACGILPGTAQSRLKVIYDKTGERGQPALMRLLSAVAAVSG